MDMVIDYTVRVVGVCVVLFVGNWLSKLVERMTLNALRKAEMDTTVRRFLARAARTTLMVLVIIACLGVFGIETTSFAAILGAAGLAIGLAFQGTLSSISAGVMLLTLRPFKVGDLIIVAGFEGIVQEIGLFTVELNTWDMRRIILPNSAVFGAPLENHSHSPKRRVEVDVGVDYGCDIRAAREVIFEACKTIEDTLDEPQAYLVGLGGSSVDFQARVWVAPERYLAVRDQLTEAVKLALDEAGISIPFPQMDVHLDKLEG